LLAKQRRIRPGDGPADRLRPGQRVELRHADVHTFAARLKGNPLQVGVRAEGKESVVGSTRMLAAVDRLDTQRFGELREGDIEIRHADEDVVDTGRRQGSSEGR